MKITKAQLKQIIKEEINEADLGDYEAMYGKGASAKDILRQYKKNTAEEDPDLDEPVNVYNAILEMVDDSYLSDDERNKVRKVLEAVFAKAGIQL